MIFVIVLRPNVDAIARYNRQQYVRVVSSIASARRQFGAWARAATWYLHTFKDRFPGMFHCSICMEEHPTSDAVRFAPCLHPFCLACAQEYVRSKVVERRFPVVCPRCATETERPARMLGSELSIISLKKFC